MKKTIFKLYFSFSPLDDILNLNFKAMYQNIRVIGFGLLQLVLTACEMNQEETVVTDYLPLQVGNYWELTFPFGKTTTYEIDAIENKDGKDYFRMVSTFFGVIRDTAFYRKDPISIVYQKRRTTDEVLMFDLAAPVNHKWVLKVDQHNHNMWVYVQSKTDTVKRNQQTFENCYRYFYNVTETADEEYSFVLAPGVGFVKYSNASFGSARLTKARINGVEITPN